MNCSVRPLATDGLAGVTAIDISALNVYGEAIIAYVAITVGYRYGDGLGTRSIVGVAGIADRSLGGQRECRIGGPIAPVDIGAPVVADVAWSENEPSAKELKRPAWRFVSLERCP